MKRIVLYLLMIMFLCSLLLPIGAAEANEKLKIRPVEERVGVHDYYYSTVSAPIVSFSVGYESFRCTVELPVGYRARVVYKNYKEYCLDTAGTHTVGLQTGAKVGDYFKVIVTTGNNSVVGEDMANIVLDKKGEREVYTGFPYIGFPHTSHL